MMPSLRILFRGRIQKLNLDIVQLDDPPISYFRHIHITGFSVMLQRCLTASIHLGNVSKVITERKPHDIDVVVHRLKESVRKGESKQFEATFQAIKKRFGDKNNIRTDSQDRPWLSDTTFSFGKMERKWVDVPKHIKECFYNGIEKNYHWFSSQEISNIIYG
jgi:hypothetical protein